MMHKVVRPFVYSTNGIHGVELVIGDVREDFGGSTAGLLAEGYIVAVEAPAPAVIAVETVAEREVAVDLLPIEVAAEVVAEEASFEMSEPVAHEAPRRGRKRK